MSSKSTDVPEFDCFSDFAPDTNALTQQARTMLIVGHSSEILVRDTITVKFMFSDRNCW